MLELIIRDELINHMEDNQLFSPKQSGFITGRSNTLQQLKVLDEWNEVLYNNGQVDVIYMDFVKAFDQVPHQRLLHKVQCYGIDGHVLCWITSFLSNRRQRVSVNNCFSSLGEVTSSSVIGPIFFIYINDLPNDVQSSAYLFSDDTKLYRKISNQTDEVTLQTYLNELQTWSDK